MVTSTINLLTNDDSGLTGTRLQRPMLTDWISPLDMSSQIVVRPTGSRRAASSGVTSSWTSEMKDSPHDGLLPDSHGADPSAITRSAESSMVWRAAP